MCVVGLCVVGLHSEGKWPQNVNIDHNLWFQEAINARSFVPPPLGEKRLDVGDVSSGLRSSDHVIEGEVRIGAQDHYYMETQCCLVVPSGEADELEILVGTQNPSGAQVRVVKIHETNLIHKLRIIVLLLECQFPMSRLGCQ